MIFEYEKLRQESIAMSPNPGKFRKYVDTTQQLLPKSMTHSSLLQLY